MADLILFTDGSVNPHSNIGYGAYLAMPGAGQSTDALRARVTVKRFEQTSSTKLELQTLLWALGEIQASGRSVIVYTDSRNIIGLPGRRNRLERNGYRSRKNRRLGNYELYRQFYRMTDSLDCAFVKVDGHKISNEKDGIDRLFSLVDRAARNALRQEEL